MTALASDPSPSLHPGRPILTLDLDGVICSPILGLNVGIHRGFLQPAAPAEPAVLPPRWLADPWDVVRFGLRRPLPEVRGALERLAAHRRLILVTGRRSSPTSWLRRYRLDRHLERVVFNEGSLRSAHFKLHALSVLGAREHVDDDPRTAQLLAEAGALTVYLRDWPRNRDVAFAAGVTRVATLAELASRVERDASPPWTAPADDAHRPTGETR